MTVGACRHVDFIMRGTVAHDAARLNLAWRLCCFAVRRAVRDLILGTVAR